MTELEMVYYERLSTQDEYLGETKIINEISPLVSVVTTTYQQAPYIRKCLDSLLNQVTDFVYEILIGEDGSSDGTREICIEYARKHPDKIRLFLRNRELTHYTSPSGKIYRLNGLFLRDKVRGKYTAFCEGDDYWYDKNKISKQVDFLKTNSEYNLIYTNYYIAKNELMFNRSIIGSLSDRFIHLNKNNFTKKLVHKNHIMLLTVLVKSNDLKNVDKKLIASSNEIPLIDYSIFIELSQMGKFKYLRKKMAVYRILDESLSHSKDLVNRFKFIESTISISKYYNKKYNYNINNRYFKSIQLSAMLKEYASSKVYTEYFKLIIKSFKEDGLLVLTPKNIFFLMKSLIEK